MSMTLGTLVWIVLHCRNRTSPVIHKGQGQGTVASYKRVVAGLVVTTDERPSPHVDDVRSTCVDCVTVYIQNVTCNTQRSRSRHGGEL